MQADTVIDEVPDLGLVSVVYSLPKVKTTESSHKGTTSIQKEELWEENKICVATRVMFCV